MRDNSSVTNAGEYQCRSPVRYSRRSSFGAQRSVVLCADLTREPTPGAGRRPGRPCTLLPRGSCVPGEPLVALVQGVPARQQGGSNGLETRNPSTASRGVFRNVGSSSTQVPASRGAPRESRRGSHKDPTSLKRRGERRSNPRSRRPQYPTPRRAAAVERLVRDPCRPSEPWSRTPEPRRRMPEGRPEGP